MTRLRAALISTATALTLTMGVAGAPAAEAKVMKPLCIKVDQVHRNEWRVTNRCNAPIRVKLVVLDGWDSECTLLYVGRSFTYWGGVFGRLHSVQYC